MWVKYAELACWAAIAVSNLGIWVAQLKRVSPRRGMLIQLDPVSDGRSSQVTASSSSSEKR